MNHFISRTTIRVARPTLLACALSTAFDASATAQTQDNSQFPPVVVTATRSEQLQTQALPHITVITAEDIRNHPGSDLPSLLRREAGIELTQSGGQGALASVFLRGAENYQKLLLVDGIPVRKQDFAGAAALEHILPEQIERIEVVRGNVSAIYGSNAVGGVIQIFTRRGDGAPSVHASVEAGSRDTLRATAGVSGSTGVVRYAVSATKFKTDGISAADPEQFPGENPDKDGYRNSSVSASLSHERTKGNEVGFRLSGNDGDFHYDGGGFGGPTDSFKGTSRQNIVTLYSKNRMTESWSSLVTLSETATRNRDTSTTAFGAFNSRYDSNTTLLQWANEIRLSDQWSVLAGADVANERADIASSSDFSSTRNDHSRRTKSVYGGLNGTVGQHHLQANIRHDDVDKSGSDTTGYLGYGYALTPAWKLIASASTAFTAPTLVQLFDPDNGNASLKSERSRSYDLGAQYAVGSVIVRATHFNTRTKNQFAIDPENCFSGAFPAGCPTFNLRQASNKGVEISASGQLLRTDMRLAITVQDPEDDSTGQKLMRRAEKLASFSASRAFGQLRLGGDLQYASDRLDRADSTLSSYWIANTSARYQISRTVSFYARAENLFDRDYQTVYGYNQVGRGIFLGVNIRS